MRDAEETFHFPLRRRLDSFSFSTSWHQPDQAFQFILSSSYKMRLLSIFCAVSTAAAFTSPALRPESTVRSAMAPFVAPSSSTARFAATGALQGVDLPEKLYSTKAKETPKVLGGLKIGLRELVCITGASSGLGLATAEELAKSGKYYVIMAVRDVEKAKRGKKQ